MVYEALRLWPPVPIDSKIAYADDVLPGGFKVPKGVQLAWAPFLHPTGKVASQFCVVDFSPKMYILSRPSPIMKG